MEKAKHEENVNVGKSEDRLEQLLTLEQMIDSGQVDVGEKGSKFLKTVLRKAKGIVCEKRDKKGEL